MKIIALLNESIPHFITASFTHILATTWSGFQVYSIYQFRQDLRQTTSKAESCGVNLCRTIGLNGMLRTYGPVTE